MTWYETYWDNQVSESVLDDIEDRTGNSSHETYESMHDLADTYMPDWVDDPGTEHQYWADFVDTFVDGNMSRDEFFEMYDIDPAEFDWDEWREIMGYD